MIYIIQTVCENGFVKIGTAKDVYRRIATLRVACPYDIRVLRILEGDRKIEMGLHVRFHEFRTKNEWFHPAPELLEYVRTTARKDVRGQVVADTSPAYQALLRRSKNKLNLHQQVQ